MTRRETISEQDEGVVHGIYIVDWDEPIMAPKERDLMFIGGGVANVWNKPRKLPKNPKN